MAYFNDVLVVPESGGGKLERPICFQKKKSKTSSDFHSRQKVPKSSKSYLTNDMKNVSNIHFWNFKNQYTYKMVLLTTIKKAQNPKTQNRCIKNPKIHFPVRIPTPGSGARRFPRFLRRLSAENFNRPDCTLGQNILTQTGMSSRRNIFIIIR